MRIFGFGLIDSGFGFWVCRFKIEFLRRIGVSNQYAVRGLGIAKAHKSVSGACSNGETLGDCL